ncbi:carbohydrate binding domain-containing protein [Alkalihalobacillus hemicellulosilyticus]|uniref:Mannan endo-1,4-beta-mannosidase n=1 Tax=Halalkalibacter hemicellulosilyticusJCM 9152 TaxID=1236971 RepID=W4QCM8_9BACI|nr:carbohydrate binding domain-containing protein [Halalkalibacter hemicellulosilyticus]GAE29712.1 mannan endo-1,4-beta-mannosidase precursor [Halalkalibacter hemicellulosilyticusJCM 9152]
MPEISIKKLTFDEGLDGVKSNGTWPEDLDSQLSHAVVDGNGMLKFEVDGMPVDETWQELKLELDGLGEELAHVTRLKFDAFIPTTAGEGDVEASVQLPPDWETKFATDRHSLGELEDVEIGGTQYKHFPVSIDVTGAGQAESIAFSLIGSQLNMLDAFYIDNVELLNAYVQTPLDPWLVDDFEGYLGDDALLHRNYSSNGDPITLRLSSEYKNNGEYGLEYDYTIGSMGYAGRQTSLGPVNWTGANAFEFWLKHDGTEHHLTVQIQIGGVSFEYNVELDEPYEGMVRIPFGDFAPAGWESNQTAIIDQSRLERVSQFALYVGGGQGEGVLYFDDLRAVYDENAAEVPEAPDSEDKEVEPIIYQFETDLEGWSGSQAQIVDGHMKAVVQLGDGITSEVQKTSGYNLTDYRYIVANVTHDESGTIADEALLGKLFVKSGGDWSWSDSGEQEINRDGYSQIIYDISELNSRESIQEIGIEFIGPTGSEGTTNAYIDYVAIVTSLDELPEEADNGSGEDPEVDPDPGIDPDPEVDPDPDPDPGKKKEGTDEDDHDNGGSKGKSGETPKPSEGDPGEKTIDDKELEVVKGDSEDELPNTATNIYSILLAGLLLIFAGGLAILIRKRSVAN